MKSSQKPYYRKSLYSLLIISIALLAACGGSGTTGPDFSSVPPPFDTTQAINRIEMNSGLIIYVIEEGGGVFNVIETDNVLMFFTGRTAEGQIFDSSYRNNSTIPRNFSNLTPVPRADITPGRLISPIMEGLRLGILGMKEGEKRTVVVPPELGFEGGQGVIDSTQVDLKGKTLIFDLELSDIR